MNSLLPTSNLRALTRPKGNYSNSVMTVSRGMISQPYPYNANIKKPNKANDYGCFKYPITQGGTSWQNYTEAEKLKEKNQFRIRESRQKKDDDKRKQSEYLIRAQTKTTTYGPQQSGLGLGHFSLQADYSQEKSVLGNSAGLTNKQSIRSYLSMMREDKEIPISAPPTELEPIFKQSATDINKSAGDSSCSEGMSKSTKKSPIRCVGLNNIGNTCFMNSILQCLLNLPDFNEQFLPTYGSQFGRVASAYGGLASLMRHSSLKAETPSEVKYAVGRQRSRFLGFSQQDAHEFLVALLQLLNREMNRSSRQKYRELSADLTKQSLDQISEQWWNYNREREDSIICDYFAGQLVSRVLCSSCRSASIAFDNAWDYALTLSREGNDVQSLLKNFLREEVISSDYYCSKCKGPRECTRKFDFYRLPKILVLQLKRFTYGTYSKCKLNYSVQVPQDLDLSPLVTLSQHHSTRNANYELVGVVNHSGGIDFGHYTAECKNPGNGQWYNFNDSTVSPTSMGKVINTSNAYVLFYSRK